MADKSEIIVDQKTADVASEHDANVGSCGRNLLEIALVFALILAAGWTPQGRLNSFFSIMAAACVLGVALAGRWGSREMGLAAFCKMVVALRVYAPALARMMRRRNRTASS